MCTERSRGKKIIQHILPPAHLTLKCVSVIDYSESARDVHTNKMIFGSPHQDLIAVRALLFLLNSTAHLLLVFHLDIFVRTNGSHTIVSVTPSSAIIHVVFFSFLSVAVASWWWMFDFSLSQATTASCVQLILPPGFLILPPQLLYVDRRGIYLHLCSVWSEFITGHLWRLCDRPIYTCTVKWSSTICRKITKKPLKWSKGGHWPSYMFTRGLIFSFQRSTHISHVYFSKLQLARAVQFGKKKNLILAQKHLIGRCAALICQCFPATANMCSAMHNSRFGPSVMCCRLPSAEAIQHEATVSELMIMHST